MKNYVRRPALIVAMAMVFSGCSQKTNKLREEKSLPNIIYILADDLGYGDLGCYGQLKFSTPHLDQLAHDGIRFTQHYSGSTVCAPSRSVLMTGLHTGHTPVRGNQEVQPEGQWPLPASALTLAEYLKTVGYVTGAFGKWGLGFPGSEGDPVRQGFDRFFGYNCQRYAHRYYPEYLWDNEKKVYQDGNDWSSMQSYAPDLIQQRAVDFIKEHRDTTFFVYLPIVIPHAELIVPDDSIYRKYLGMYPETPYVGGPGADYGPDMEISMYCSQEHPHATFAAMVHRIDWYVGEIAGLLDELGLRENTIIMFTSDNGPHREGGADPGFFNSNGRLRGFKRDLYEGGIRVPLIVSWPGTIEQGRTSDHTSAFWDLLPTLADLTGFAVKKTDGISFLPELFGEEQPKHPFLYWEFHERGGKQAMRMDQWKAVRLQVGKNPDGPLELYNLTSDPFEENNVADAHPDLVETFAKMMEEEREPSAKFNFGRAAD
ncbi:MAG: arylsulfatase [Bacteroidales bacterium]|nr:arylsulfatase [Bacteroidales bacterium]